jgi:3-oxoacyl-[acyl-carrier protein] reductase
MARETRVALVTGAQQGIGAAATRALAAAGHDVAINWLDDQAQAEAVAAEIRASGRRAALIRGDVGTAAGAAALVEQTVAALGRIDVLVNNAGIFPRVEFLEMTEAEWDRVIAVNLKGSAFCAQAAARAMVAAGVGVEDARGNERRGSCFSAGHSPAPAVRRDGRPGVVELAPGGLGARRPAHGQEFLLGSPGRPELSASPASRRALAAGVPADLSRRWAVAGLSRF